METCSIEGCEKPKRARGWCTVHWRRWKTTGDPSLTLWDKRKENKPVVCVIELCELPIAYLGFCNGHYRRYLVHGDPLHTPLKTQEWGLKTCTIDGCKRRHNAKGLCNMHYLRMRHHNDVNYTKKKESRVTLGYVYKGSKPEHRVVMEESLGRKLLSKENVHHINGDRTDNRIENLELWSKSQPSGQRVEDKIDHAIYILKHYAPKLLKENPNE